MKITQPFVIGLSLLALAACRSSEPASTQSSSPEGSSSEGAAPEEMETIEEVVPVSMPEVRYYEIADT